MMKRTYVALLRGINVGGKNLLPMKALAMIFEEAACGDVRTYIQSGNVVFRTDERKAERASDAVSKMIHSRFGLTVPVVLRTAEELEGAVLANPFPPEFTHVVFLLNQPTEPAVAGLDPGRSPGDEFIVKGREIFLHLPHGAGNSKLTNAYFDSKLKTVSTARNWRTVLKLLEMTGAS